MNTTNNNFKLGQALASEGLCYTEIPLAVETLTGATSVNSSIYMGFDECMRVTRQGFSTAYWSKTGDKYKTSSDLSTLF